MKTVLKKVADLQFAEYNPRKLSIKQARELQESIEQFGFVEPIVVNVHPERKNVIVGGHQRVRIAEKMGIKEVPCVEVSLDIEKERELNVRLNKNTGEWDIDVLLTNFNPAELINWGFEERELGIDVGHLNDDPRRPAPVRADISVAFQLGELRFEIPSKNYIGWMDEMITEGKLTNKEKIVCVRQRLKLN